MLRTGERLFSQIIETHLFLNRIIFFFQNIENLKLRRNITLHVTQYLLSIIECPQMCFIII